MKESTIDLLVPSAILGVIVLIVICVVFSAIKEQKGKPIPAAFQGSGCNLRIVELSNHVYIVATTPSGGICIIQSPDDK